MYGENHKMLEWLLQYITKLLILKHQFYVTYCNIKADFFHTICNITLFTLQFYFSFSRKPLFVDERHAMFRCSGLGWGAAWYDRLEASEGHRRVNSWHAREHAAAVSMNSLRIGDLGFVTACYESSACQRIKECVFFSLEDTIQLEQRHKEMHRRFSLVRR